MANIALDAFAPTEACFEEPPKVAKQKDNCTVTVNFHVTDENTDYRPVIFQREKDRFVIDPNLGSSNPAIITALFPPTKVDSIQSTLHFSVAISKLHRRTYSILATGMKDEGEVIYPYTGPDLKPLLDKVMSFYAVGNIENPDKLQSATNSAITRETLVLPHSPRAWSLKLYQSLLDPKLNLNMTPETIRPRVRWFADQLECMNQLIKPWIKTSPTSQQDPIDLALAPDSDIYKLYVDLLDYLFNDTSATPAQIIAKMDPIAKRMFPSKDTPENSKDFYAFVQNKLTEFSQKPSFVNNTSARQRLNTLLTNLNSAISEHRAELLSLEPNAALRKSIEYNLSTAAKKEGLARLVKFELAEANLHAPWIQTNAAEITKALIPHFSFARGPTSSRRIEVNADDILESIHKLTAQHYVQEREYKIGALAILRHLLGSKLSNPKMLAWDQGAMKELEVNIISKGEFKDLSFLGQQLSKQIGQSVAFTDKGLPWIEGAVGVTGLGIAGLGLGIKGIHRSALSTTGAGVLGFGVGALTCNLAWQSRNKYLSDLLCGAIGAAAFSVTAHFALPKNEISNLPDDLSSNDGRNPVTGFGP